MTHENPTLHGHSNRADARSGGAAEFWNERYGAGQVWSGRVNQLFAEAVVDLPPGRSLDLGCGEGGDVLWLAERGWQASGIDISVNAIERAQQSVADRGLPKDRVHFVAADLCDWVAQPEQVDGSTEKFDLISASYMQSPLHLPREQVLRVAASRIAPGGYLVLVSHGARMPWMPEGHGPAEYPTPESELAALALDDSEWEVVRAEQVGRPITDHDGNPAEMLDTVVVVQRRV